MAGSSQMSAAKQEKAPDAAEIAVLSNRICESSGILLDLGHIVAQYAWTSKDYEVDTDSD